MDYRNALYDRYVSTFKSDWLDSERDLISRHKWCEYKYLPLLRDVNRTGAVLELGCGPGYTLEFLKRAGFANAKGIDISIEQVAIARGRGMDATVADVFGFLRSESDKYALVVAIDFLEHFTKNELTELVTLIRQSLTPKGVLLLQTINGSGLLSNGLIYGDMTHSTILSIHSIKQLLRVIGFDHIQFFETSPVSKNAIGLIRNGLWRIIRFIANAVRLVETGRTEQILTQNFICRATRAADRNSIHQR